MTKKGIYINALEYYGTAAISPHRRHRPRDGDGRRGCLGAALVTDASIASTHICALGACTARTKRDCSQGTGSGGQIVFTRAKRLGLICTARGTVK